VEVTCFLFPAANEAGLQLVRMWASHLWPLRSGRRVPQRTSGL